MGCDTKIFLPPEVRVKDIMTVLGILSGGKKEKVYFSCNSNMCFYVKVDNIKSISTHTPEMVQFQIKITDPFINELNGLENNGYANPYFFFENETKIGWKLLVFGSRSFSIEIAKGLVNFFGGQADFNDCDDIDIDIKKQSKPKKWLAHIKDKDYAYFQNALWKLDKIRKE